MCERGRGERVFLEFWQSTLLSGRLNVRAAPVQSQAAALLRAQSQALTGAPLRNDIVPKLLLRSQSPKSQWPKNRPSRRCSASARAASLWNSCRRRLP